MILPKLVVTDIDGVWTDGGMYYDQTDVELKKFNTYDSAGVLWCKLNEIPVAIITGENTQIVQRRADKLQIEHVFLGIKNKVEVLDQLLKQLSISWQQTAYLGDDINDMLVMEKVGFSACPKSAPSYVQKIADKVIDRNGGEGVFRSFVEGILSHHGLMDSTVSKYLDNAKSKLNQ